MTVPGPCVRQISTEAAGGVWDAAKAAAAARTPSRSPAPATGGMHRSASTPNTRGYTGGYSGGTGGYQADGAGTVSQGGSHHCVITASSDGQPTTAPRRRYGGLTGRPRDAHPWRNGETRWWGMQNMLVWKWLVLPPG